MCPLVSVSHSLLSLSAGFLFVMNFYHMQMLVPPQGLQDEDSDGDSVTTVVVPEEDDSDPDEGVLYEAACPDLVGTPPQPPNIRVRLCGVVPSTSNKRRRLLLLDDIASDETENPEMPYCQRQIPMDVWRYMVIPYVDLVGLLRLSMVCREIRDHLHHPKTIDAYLRTAWFTKKPHCDCNRSQYRVDVGRICEFYYDRLGVYSARDMEVALRAVGRGVDMYDDPRRSRPIRPVEMPRQNDRRYEQGVLSVYYDSLIVPLPRILTIPVEAQRCDGLGFRTWNRPREPDEDTRAYQQRIYWRGCHNVEEPAADRPGSRDDGFVTGPYVDPVQLYLQRCDAEGRDPADPAVDDEAQSGYHAEHWAKYQMHRGPVGIQSYPGELCLGRTEIRGSAFRRGLSELELLFLPAERAPTQGDGVQPQILLHNGLVYFHPVRYFNETSDFVPWCLSTLTVLRSLRQYLWYDAMLYIHRRLVEFALLVATEVQNDMTTAQMMLRWEFIQRTEVRMEAQWPPPDYDPNSVPRARGDPRPPTPADGLTDYTHRMVEIQKARNERAGRLLRCPLYTSFNQHIQRKIQEYERSPPSRQSGGSFRDGYLVSMLPTMYDHAPTPHTEVGLMRALHRQIWLTDYIVEFAGSIGPRVDNMTDVRRNRTLATYVGTATSLLAFAPGFTDRPPWAPRSSLADVGSVVPRIDLRHNHRYRLYRDFVYARQHYYDSTAPLYAPRF